jgi:hypothetical protein
MEMWNSNQWLLDLIGGNWMVMIIVYTIVRTIWPGSALIVAVGDAFSNLFPQFKKNETKN